jgi:hypothetical protein
LEIGDVVLIDLPEQGGEVEATVIRDIDRTDRTVRVTLRMEGRDDLSRSGSRRDGHHRAWSLKIIDTVPETGIDVLVSPR